MSMFKRLLPLLMVLMLVLTFAGGALAEPSKLTIEADYTVLFQNDTLQLTLIRTGETAEGDVKWSSTEPKIASVDENGLVTCKRAGSATIVARVNGLKATLALSIKKAVTSIGFNESKVKLYDPKDPKVSGLLTIDTALPVLQLKVGTPLTYTPKVVPTNASNRNVTIISSDETVLEATAKKLTPISAGECELTMVSDSNPQVTYSCHVLVLQPVTKLTIVGEQRVSVGGQLQLSTDAQPETASNTSVTWKSSSSKIAAVDENGLVTGKSKGSVTIKATAQDGSGKTASYKLTVVEPVSALKLNNTSLSLATGKSSTLKVTVSPSSASDKTVTWSSTDTSVVTVNKNGSVTAVAPGSAVVICRSNDQPSIIASAVVTVYQPVTKISFSSSSVDVNINESINLSWTVQPSNATSSAVSFSSSKPSVATIDPDGTVHALSRGTATITAKAEDGSGKKATIQVNVLQPVTGVYMDQTNWRIGVDEDLELNAVLLPSNASNTRMRWSSSDTSVAIVVGTRTKATVSGRRWGTCTITGVTEDGGYTISAVVQVGNYDQALQITELYVNDNAIKMSVQNVSNMDMTRFWFRVEVFDTMQQPLICTRDNSHIFYGYYLQNLVAGEKTVHGRFNFGTWLGAGQPIGMVKMAITGYSTVDNFTYMIPQENQIIMTYGGSLPGPATPSEFGEEMQLIDVPLN